MANFLRRRVSQNRRRFVSEKYDLDLTYITENLIAMGYPSEGVIQSLIRNPIETVSKYLRENHLNCYKIYNLCLESEYSFVHFDNMVEMLPIEDHNPPKFTQIEPFCRSVQDWLNQHEEHVAIIHCKAGKGRTGTMISCCLIYSKSLTDPFLAMNYFAAMRCRIKRGVTIPSQRRYIEYFADYMQNSRVYESTNLILSSIVVHLPEDSKDFPKKLRLRVFQDVRQVYDSKSVKRNPSFNTFTFDLNGEDEGHNLTLRDDVKVNIMTKKKECLFKVIFNTFCLIQPNEWASDEQSYFGTKVVKENGELEWCVKKKDIDLAFKDKSIATDLSIVFHFKIPEKSQIASVDDVVVKHFDSSDNTSRKNSASSSGSNQSDAEAHADKTEKTSSQLTELEAEISQKLNIF